MLLQRLVGSFPRQRNRQILVVSLELLHSAVMAAMVVGVDLQAWETTERLPAPVARHVQVMRSGVVQVLPAGQLQRQQPHL